MEDINEILSDIKQITGTDCEIEEDVTTDGLPLYDIILAADEMTLGIRIVEGCNDAQLTILSNNEPKRSVVEKKDIASVVKNLLINSTTRLSDLPTM